MVLIEQSVETPRSLNMAARSLAGPTSRRPCRCADLKEASHRRCPVSEDTTQDFEKALHTKRSSEVVETISDEVVEKNVDLRRVECRDTQISYIAGMSLAEPPEACRPQ
jgi:hypothetical protein